jgi:hypothetical protein
MCQLFDEDSKEAFEWWRKLAEQGYASAQYELGNRYYLGRGVYKNEDEAVKWFRQAMNQGCIDTLSNLEYGEYVSDNIELLRKVAEQGYAEAQYMLGNRYTTIAHWNPDEAVKWWRKAAEQGHAAAQKELAKKSN